MFRHEIFITNDAVSLINKKENTNKSKAEICEEARKYCDDISQHLDLKKGMSVMIVVRLDQKENRNVYFVYNQCLDSSSPASPSDKFVDHNPSLNINTHIFKPTGGNGGLTRHPANKYHSWFKKRSARTIFEGKSKKSLWK